MRREPQTLPAEKKKKGPLVWTLLAMPYLALCFPQLYARNNPVMLGFPFFYWYQFVWVVLTSVLLGIVYRKLRD